MPAPRFTHGFENDVFLSHTHVDDEADVTGCHWITQFQNNLRTRLAQVSGRSIHIWRDNNLGAADRFDREIAAQLSRSAVMVAILTPSYFQSDYCRDEREQFRRVAADIGSKARIVKVAKTHVDLDSYPDDLRSLLEHRFYVEEAAGIAREFQLHDDPAIQRRYASRMDDVALEISGILRLLEHGAPPPATRGTVFLAETSSDLEEARAAIRRTLVQRGYEVLPRSPLRLHTAPEIRKILAEDLAASRVTIHPVGTRYGVVPELGGDASIVRIQLEAAAQDRRNGALSRVVWIPEGLQPEEDSQLILVQRIREHWAGNPFQLIEGPLQKFETDLLDCLEPPRLVSLPPTAAARKRPSVYLLCSGDEDRKASRAVRFWLHGQDLDVEWPARDGSSEKHMQRLVSDDAFLIYYGQCAEEWVRDGLAQLAAAAEHAGRSNPCLSKAVFLADPETDDKLDFLTHEARILEGYERIALEQSLAPLVAEIWRGWPLRLGSAGGQS